MKHLITNISISFMMATIAKAGLVAKYDFSSKNTPQSTWQYQDSSGNGHHGDELGSWYNLNGDTGAAADMFENAGGARGGVYSYRWDYEADYDSDQSLDGNFDGATGVFSNNRVDIGAQVNMPNLAANAGMTLALWVNPQNVFFDGEARPHYGSDTAANADFAHLVILGGYGNTPIMSLELDSSRRVHGWVEGDGTDTQVEVTGDASIVANDWTHIAITYDRANNEAKTYINGLLDSTTDITGVGDGELTFTSARIGGGLSGSGGTGSVFFGQIDDVYIYDEVLGQTEIASLVPEPGFYALLFACPITVLALAVRRRRK